MQRPYDSRQSSAMSSRVVQGVPVPVELFAASAKRSKPPPQKGSPHLVVSNRVWLRFHLKESCARVGGNASITADPGAVHFPGYTLEGPNVASFRLRNMSASRQRVQVLLPDTIEFDMEFDNQGWMAPGLSQQVRVLFRPTSWRYHADQIRVHHPDGNFIVPIHAYPVVSDLVFPTVIDMGNCDLGASATRTVTMRSDVPVDFEFRLTPVKTSPEFAVEPLQVSRPTSYAACRLRTRHDRSGTGCHPWQRFRRCHRPVHAKAASDGGGLVPGPGSPHTLRDCSPQFNIRAQVHISQFAFKPFLCTVRASSTFDVKPAPPPPPPSQEPAPTRALSPPPKRQRPRARPSPSTPLERIERVSPVV